MTKTATVGLVVLAMTLGGCATVREHPAETPAAPASGAKLGEIAGPAFDTARARLTDAGRAQVDAVVHTLQQYPDLHVAIDGHTDSHGSGKYNQKLSERRARAVANRLTEQGIAAARVSVHGFGETRPIADNRTPEGRARNRRVEIVVE